ncbi:hypothetical protein F5Y13DRAFT_62184 [Hypoxylon sp. FL1857]|nr:hypothetical protein F5Y13DRAFT_62184 [Hypoxylon sp. FL1857]
MSTFYEFRMYNLQERFKIDKAIWGLLQAHENFKTGRVTHEAMANAARPEVPAMNKLVGQLTEIAQASAGSGDDAKYCLAIIRVVNDIISIANTRPAPIQLESLPVEVRWRIYRHYFRIPRSQPLVPRGPRGQGYLRCRCDNPDETDPVLGPRTRDRKVDISLALTSKFMHRDVLNYLYNQHLLYFPCACNMAYHVRTNAILKESLARVMFHWTGIAADIGITALRPLHIHSLTVVVSKVTGMNVTDQELAFREFFIANGPNTLPQTRGIYELMSLRGISTLNVQEIARWRAPPRARSELRSLSLLLQDNVTRPREDEDDDTA